LVFAQISGDPPEIPALAMIEAREGLVYDSDAPGHVIVRGPHAALMRFTVKGLEAHAGA
jgi:hypothetical protein